MPNSTYYNRFQALTNALADSGPLRYTDNTDALDNYAANMIRDLQNGGWNLIHADDLPAGYVPGDALSGSPTALRYPFLTYAPEPSGGPLPEPVAVLGETPDEMRRRLPTTNPTPSRDQDPFAQSPQEPSETARELANLAGAVNANARDAETRLADHDRQIGDLHQDATRNHLRTTTLEERVSDHDDRIDHYTAQSDTNARAIDTNADDTRRHEAMITDLDGRLSALEITTRNVTEMRRELDDLHDEEARVMAEVRRLEDPDTQLGGHDNPNPSNANEHDNADDSNA